MSRRLRLSWLSIKVAASIAVLIVVAERRTGRSDAASAVAMAPPPDTARFNVKGEAGQGGRRRTTRNRSKIAEPEDTEPASRAVPDDKRDGQGPSLADTPLPEKRPVYPGETPVKPTIATSPADAAPAAKDALRNTSLPAQFGPPSPQTWTEAEVKAGRGECTSLLSGIEVEKTDLPPLREGGCGLPAPISLKALRIKDTPSLEIDPEATVSCKLTASLNTWFASVVQPKAKAHLGSPVVKIQNASAYVCRTRYNDPLQRISAHAYANAIDITEFVTAKGERVTVLSDWSAGGEKGAFLHEIHDAACEIFGTTLGPESNEAHKNHFHLDMIERRHGLCDFAPGQLASKQAAAERAKTAVAPSVPAPPASKIDEGKPAPAPEQAAKGDNEASPKRRRSRTER